MANISTKVETRLISALKRFQPILNSAKSRDINESDTVVIISDLLNELFGFDKYSEVTSEYAIRGTYCDLAIKIKDKVQLLIEAKAIGLELKELFIKQAVDYAANQGVDWVILTNGDLWKVFKVIFGKPINQELFLEFKITELNPKKDLEILYLLTKEGILKQELGEFYTQKQALNRFSIAALITSDSIVDTLRKTLRKIDSEIRVDADQIKTVILQEVLKREVIEGEKAEEAQKKINRALNRIYKNRSSKEDDDESVLNKAISQSMAQNNQLAA